MMGVRILGSRKCDRHVQMHKAAGCMDKRKVRTKGRDGLFPNAKVRVAGVLTPRKQGEPGRC